MEHLELSTDLGLYPFPSAPLWAITVVYKGKFATVTKFLNIYVIYISSSKNNEQKTFL